MVVWASERVNSLSQSNSLLLFFSSMYCAGGRYPNVGLGSAMISVNVIWYGATGVVHSTKALRCCSGWMFFALSLAFWT